MDDHNWRYHRENSLSSALVSINREGDTTWRAMASRVYLKIKYIQKPENYDYKKSAHINTVHEGDPLRDIYSVNEHLAVLLSFVANILILLVFTRVLGMARLPSRIIVSMAVANLLGSFGDALHTTSVSVRSLSNTPSMCRFIPFFLGQAWVVYFLSLSTAIVERILACNLPIFYSRAVHIIGPAILVTPWAFWTFNFILQLAGAYEYDAGYECSNHVNSVLPLGGMNAGPKSTSAITLVLAGALLLSMLLHNQNSGDVWEINRMQFELRTTAVIIKLATVCLAFSSPMIVLPMVRVSGMTYQEYRLVHLAYQVSIHKGLGLMLVLLSRHEFRKQLVLVFESSEAIRRTRTTNLLITHGPARNYSSRMLRFSGNTTHPKESASEQSANVGRVHPQTVSAQPQPLAVTTSAEQGLVSRDKISTVHTPEWLRKRETKPNWHWSRMFSRGGSTYSTASSGSDV